MVSRNIPHEYFLLDAAKADGPVVGHLRGKPISAVVIDRNGGRYRFVGIAARDGRGRLDVMSLKQGEWILAPDLVYTEAALRFNGQSLPRMMTSGSAHSGL